MSNWAPRQALEAALRALDKALQESPAVQPRFERANLLADLGRTEEAKSAYIELLKQSPTHAGALNNLGTLLYSTGYRTAARTVYAEAALRHPDDPMGHVNLANLLLEAGELAAAREHYETAIRLAPDHPEAHQGLGNVLAELGDDAGAARHRRLGYTGRALTTWPYRGAGPPLSLLLLVSAAGGNVPIRPLLDDRVFMTHAVVAEYFDPAQPLPPHALVFNAIGDADLSEPALEAAEKIVAMTKAPLINPPAAVRSTGRIANARRFAGLPGVIAPRIANLSRSELAAGDAATTLARLGFSFPLLLRTPGFHTGRHFEWVENAAEISAALDTLPGRELSVIERLDARGADGKSRKYRVMLIDNRLYPLHLAVSSHWKVHYFTAEMGENPAYRAEEAAFLNDMPGILGSRATAALAAVRDGLGLDYAGIDFGLNGNGEILLFEANATMVVNPPEPDERWAYRRALVEQIHAAVRRMLEERARHGDG